MDEWRTEKNFPVDLEIRDEYIWITLKDGRIVAAPLHWYSWLENATPEQQANYDLGPFSITWDDLGEGFDMEAILIGRYMRPEDFITVSEMATMHDIAANTVQRILRKDQQLEEDERRIPGSFKSGTERRGEWLIPRNAAEAWAPGPGGRKKVPTT